MSVPTSRDAAEASQAAQQDLAGVERAMAALLQPSFPGSVLPAMAQACLRSGGKRMRAQLALTASAALGVAAPSAQAWACACELMHNATLVHDDLQDGDEVRRGQPTVWVAHGAAQAINVGDWLFMAAFRALAQLAPNDAARAGAALATHLAQGLAEVIEGQGLECASVDYLGRIDAFPYDTMVRGKTAALFALPVLGAATLAGQSDAEARASAAAFAELGVLFQMQDDVLDLWGDKGRGRRGNDLYEGKLSCVVTTHVRLRPQDAAWLGALLGKARAEVTAGDVAAAMDRFAEAGTLAAVLADMRRRSQALEAACAPPLRPAMAQLLARTWAPLAALPGAAP